MELIKQNTQTKIIKLLLIIFLGSILLTISSKIKIPFYPVPMTMQTFVVLFLGISFGYKIALASVSLYLIEGILGLPVFSNSPERGVGLTYFVGPTIFDDVRPEMKIYKEEIFGPVLSMMTTETYEEALNLVNEHELGNGAAVFTKSGNIAKHFTENAKIGMIGVNVPIPVPVAYHSFGGWKRSLFGDHSMHGPEGVRFYTKLKTATVTWVEDNAGPEFTIPVLS